MGTNFYHRFNKCDCCGRYDERHICKSGVIFRGYRRPDYLDSDDPFTEVLSWADWKGMILAGGEVWDEYGEKSDVRDFIAYVESHAPEQRRRQFDWMLENDRESIREGRDWLDAEGFSFYSGEFT